MIFSADGGVHIAIAPGFESIRICALPKPLKENSYHSAIMDGDGDLEVVVAGYKSRNIALFHQQ